MHYDLHGYALANYKKYTFYMGLSAITLTKY